MHGIGAAGPATIRVLRFGASILTSSTMLIKFDGSAGTLTMFGDIALQLLKLAGHSGAVPGAMLAADLPEAVRRLEQGLGTVVEPVRSTEDEPGAAPIVSLQQRAFPLLKLLKASADGGHDVMWDRT